MTISHQPILEYLPEVKDDVLKAMLSDLANGPVIYQPSEFWVQFLKMNIRQLEYYGIENFKQSVNNNYFNWLNGEHKGSINQQQKRIIGDLDAMQKLLMGYKLSISEDREDRHGFLKKEDWKVYRKFVAVLWEYTLKHDKLRLLRKLNEPLLGNPMSVNYGMRTISQDICNSVLEVNSLGEGMKASIESADILELGGGYGRIADLLLRSFPDVKVTMVDIPPALQICEWYLSKLHDDRKIFGYRSFKSYEDIKAEFAEASVRFLLPHQLELIPDKSFTLFINISSFHEMRPEQVANWFDIADRLVSGYLYSKQWISFANTFDDVVMDREFYPVKKHWQAIYNRKCKVQEDFFEALYRIS